MYFFKFRFVLLLMAISMGASAQKLKFLIPDEAIVQYAGSIGYFSGGAGYELFGNKRGNVDLLYGFVPGSKGGILHIATAKFFYRPFEIKLKNWGKFYPINPGVFVTYTFNKQLSFNFDTKQYPKGYYYWSEAIRPHLSFTNEIEFNADQIMKGSGFKTISLYSEFNTNDYYMINYLQNIPTISLTDIFQLGIGIRLKF